MKAGGNIEKEEIMQTTAATQYQNVNRSNILEAFVAQLQTIVYGPASARPSVQFVPGIGTMTPTELHLYRQPGGREAYR